MKKQIMIAAAALLTIGAFSAAAIEWDSVENLAKGAEVTVSSKDSAKSNITDGDDGSGWQAFPETHAYTQDWAIINLGEAKDINSIEIVWEAAHASAYSVYASLTPFTVSEYKAEDGVEAYKTVDIVGLTPIATDTDTTESNYTATLSLGETVKAQYFLVYCTEYNNYGRQHGAQIKEFKVANVAGAEYAEVLKFGEITPVVAGSSTTVTISAANVAGDPIDINTVSNLKLTANDQSVVIEATGTVGEFKVTGNAYGNYTLTATGTANDTEISATAQFAVNYNWAYVENNISLASAKVSARFTPDVADDYEHPASAAIDGNTDTYYQYDGAWGGGDAWVVVDLGKEYKIETLGATFVNGGGTMKFAYAPAGATLPQGDVKWDNPEGWTSLNSISRALKGNITPYEFETPVLARYIAVIDTDNPGGKPMLTEIYAAGIEYEQPVASDIKIVVTPGFNNLREDQYVVLKKDEEAAVKCQVLDQYGDVMENQDVTISVTGPATYADGTLKATEGNGIVTIAATCGELTVNGSIYVSDGSGYVMEGAKVTSDNETIDGAYAIDGGAEVDNSGKNDYVVTDNDRVQEHWIKAELAFPCDLDLIVAYWEGACPGDYTISVSSDDVNYTEVGNITGHKQANWRDGFFGKEMKNVKYIYINITSVATGWGIKLHDLKAYGKSLKEESVPTTIVVNSDKDFIHASYFKYITDPNWDGVSGDPNVANHQVPCGYVKGEVANLTFTVYDQYDLVMDGYTADDVVVSVDNSEYAVVEGLSFYVGADKSKEAYEYLKENNWNANTMDVYKGALGNYTVTVKLKNHEDVSGSYDIFAACYGNTELKDDFKKNSTVADASNGQTNLNGELQFELNKPVVIEFDQAYDFSMIRFNWEIAAAGSYTIVAEDEDGKTWQIHEVTGRKVLNGINPVDVMVDTDNILQHNKVMRAASAVDTSNSKATLTGIKKLTVNVTEHNNNNGWTPRLLSTNFYGVNTGGDITTVIDAIEEDANDLVDVYNFSGVLLRNDVKRSEALKGLDKGLYIVGGKKVMK